MHDICRLPGGVTKKGVAGSSHEQDARKEKAPSKSPAQEKEENLNVFYRRIEREISSIDRHELDQEKRRYIKDKMAQIHKPGDGCMEDGE